MPSKYPTIQWNKFVSQNTQVSKELPMKCPKIRKMKPSIHIVPISDRNVSNRIHELNYPMVFPEHPRNSQVSTYNRFHTLNYESHLLIHFMLEDVEILFRVFWASWNPCPSLSGLVEPILATHRVVALVHQLTSHFHSFIIFHSSYPTKLHPLSHSLQLSP